MSGNKNNDIKEVRANIIKADLILTFFIAEIITSPATIGAIYSNNEITLPKNKITTDRAVKIPENATNFDFFIFPPSKYPKIVNQL